VCTLRIHEYPILEPHHDERRARSVQKPYVSIFFMIRRIFDLSWSRSLAAIS
jgi:hypothetical protein